MTKEKRKVNVKQRKSAEKINYADLEDKYKLLKNLMDYIPDVIYFKDRKGRLILVNKTHAKGLGLSPEEVVGKTDFDIFSKRRAAMMAKDDEYVMTTGKPIIDKIERSTRPDGVDNFVSTTKIPRYDDKGNVIGLIGITRDITHRMQLEYLKEEGGRIKRKLESLEELSRMKSEFISVISHELKNPLSIVKEGISLVLDEVKGKINEVQKDLLVTAKNNVEHLRKIIDELLDISRIERGKVKLHYSLVNLNDLIRGTEDYFKRLAQEKDLSLKYNLPKEPINIFVDQVKVNQMTSNLIDNAIKFTEQGGTVEIEVKVFADKVRIGVIDTGIGIAKQDLDRIFDKFVQVPTLSRLDKKGLGLGLSIVKELTQRHGGEIWAESEMGIGSRFYFTLSRFFTTKMLDKDIRDKINDLLDKGISFYLINLSVINFKEFQKLMRLESRKLISELKIIINNSLKEFSRLSSKKYKILTTDFQQGECNVIFAEAREKEVMRLCNLFREKINKYFIKNKIEDTFINVGILDLTYQAAPPEFGRLPANIHIKKIHIGAEKRRFKRVDYKVDIEPFFAEAKIGPAYTLDISEGGVCFVTKKQLKTDDKLMIKLNLPKYKQFLQLTGRVAWLKEIEEPSKEGTKEYKAGLEFTNLSKKDRKTITKLIKSLSAPKVIR